MNNANISQSQSSHTLRILTWNANGLLSRKTELTQFLNTEEVHIALISETHLNDRQHAKFKGYKMYVCNHPDNASHGGAAVLIKENLSDYEIANFRT